MPQVPEKYKELKRVFFNELEHIPHLKLNGLPPAEIPDNSADFLFIFLSNWNDKYPTVDCDNRTVTALHKKRSAQETFDIIKSYFPKYTLIQYLKDIFTLLLKCNKEKDRIWGFIILSYCCTVHRDIFLPLFGCTFVSTRNFTLNDKNVDSLMPVPIFAGTNSIYSIKSGYFWKYLNDPELIKYILEYKS